MKYKKEILKLLFDLKNVGIERAKIEKDLNYSDNYIDQTLAKGGNKRFYENLKKYSERVLQNATEDIKQEATLPGFMGESKEFKIAVTSAIKIILLKIAEIESEISKRGSAELSLELERMIQQERQRQQDELRKQ